MSSWLVKWMEREFERQREDEFRALMRRPDALPLPPEEPGGPSIGDRWSHVVDGWRSRAGLTDAGRGLRRPAAPRAAGRSGPGTGR